MMWFKSEGNKQCTVRFQVSTYMYIIILTLQFNEVNMYQLKKENKLKVENNPFHAYSILQEEMHAFVN